MIQTQPQVFDLTLANNQIQSIYNVQENARIDNFMRPLTGNQFKIYVITEKKEFLYVGTTKSSIRNRLRYGLTADGRNGYHGYKWKTLLKARLFVWCFNDFDKEKIENVEAELVYIIRKQTGKWPTKQNEIHFNNSFAPKGQLIAENLFKQLTNKLE